MLRFTSFGCLLDRLSVFVVAAVAVVFFVLFFVIPLVFGLLLWLEIEPLKLSDISNINSKNTVIPVAPFMLSFLDLTKS